jgi:unsaturated rhamnogalacturonyl hydrolase
MKRRNFIFSMGLGSGAVVLSPLPAFASVKNKGKSGTIKKVKRAMLSIQRMSWEQGTAAQALLESGDSELVILFAKEAVLRQGKDGRLAQVDSINAVTDPASNGEALLFAFMQTGEEYLKKASDAMLEYLMSKAPKTPDGILYHINNESQIWIDAMYMAPPFFAVAGAYDESIKQVEGFRKYLWNNEKKLFSHIWDESKKNFGRKDFWGVGNGWAAAGMTRVVKALPDEYKEAKKKIIGYIKEVLDGCLMYQREDGLFHNVVDDSSSFVETNLSQMLAYTIFRGAKAGWLDPSYLNKAEKMRSAVHLKVDKYGLVQGVCGSPDFNHSGTACEGQAFYLLMEVAYKDLQKK